MMRFSLFVCLLLLLLFVPAGIPIAAASPTISSVSPSSGTYGTEVTITVRGTGFDSSSKVILVRCPNKYGTTGRVDGTTTSWSADTITARFRLSGSMAPGGDYDVVVSSLSGSGYYLKGFFINGGPTTTTTTTTTTTATATTTTTTAIATTTTTSAQCNKNTVIFESDPSGARISLSGNFLGTTPYTYCTDTDGTFSVVLRKTGYEDYDGRVTIREGQRVYFDAELRPLSSTTTAPASTVTTSASNTSASGNPVSTVTTIRRSTLKIPTPLGTDPPLTESPADPALALGAACIAIGLVLLRRG